MLKFFRRIRKNLLENEHTTKYLFYAIGEVILVVIGILIALQLNNWNEAKNNRKEEIRVLQNLLVDLEEAKNQSNSVIQREKKTSNYLEAALRMNQGVLIDSLDLNSNQILYYMVFDLPLDVPVINAYTDIKNTGKSELISNQTIREQFTNLELEITSLNRLIEDRLTVQQLRIDDIAVNDINFVPLLQVEDPELVFSHEIKNDFISKLSDQKIRNLLAIRLSLTIAVIRFRENLNTDIDELIELLETELEESID